MTVSKPYLDGVLHGLLRGADGVLRAALEHGQSGLLTHDLKLLDGGGAVDVAGGQKDVLAAFFEHLAQLRAVRRFARALQTAHQDDRRRLGGDLQPAVGAAHQGDQLLVDNLDNLLRGHEAFEHLAAHRALRDLGHEVLDDLEIDVRLQQRELDLAHAGLDVGLGQLAFVPKFRESLRHFVNQALKHIRTLPLQREDSLRRRADGLIRALFQNTARGALIFRLARDKAERALQKLELLLPALQSVADALSGDAEMLGHLGERQVVVVIQIQRVAAAVAQRAGVAVVQQR